MDIFLFLLKVFSIVLVITLFLMLVISVFYVMGSWQGWEHLKTKILKRLEKGFLVFLITILFPWSFIFIYISYGKEKTIAYFKDMVVDIVEQLITTIVMVSVFLLTLVGSLIYINNNPYQFKKTDGIWFEVKDIKETDNLDLNR